jgi:cell division protein FtsB
MAEGCQKCFCVTLDKSNRTENGKILEIGGNKMQRTISAMVGKGSVNHNSRKFKAENVDDNRTHLNIDYCNENIKKVYHELFDEALERYNYKQTRADRKIENYYEKIRNSKQEKPFHELILQIGDKENMSAESENGELARQILDEYYSGFQERNPNLKVFSAHLHMDEATPHLHIDFVPFTTGSKRGLDTRVSLKQALAAQGFKGGTRGDTEWNQWVSAEKSALAFVMERHGIEWEHKGTHEKHLSVLDYKKHEREKEIAVLDNQLAEKKDEFRVMADRIENFDNGEKSLQKLDESIMNEPEYQLPEPPAMMSARTYKAKFVEPLIARFKSLISTLFARYFKALDSYHRLNITNGNLYRENEKLAKVNEKLSQENENLRAENRNYKLLRKVFGHKQIDDLLERARNIKGQKRDNTRSR